MKLMRLPFAALAALFALTGQATAQVNITTWQVNGQHTGNNAAETILTPGIIKSPGNFGFLFSQPMDGLTFGQPLLVSGLTVGGATHNVVYAATEHCSLYAFDADSNTGANAAPLWQVSLLPTGTVPVPQGVVGSGDIPIELGITTTPVIDAAGGTIYIVSKVQRTADATYHQYLYALDLVTGAAKFNSPVEIATSFPGTARDAVSNKIPFSPLHEHLRCAMALNDGVLYLAYASHSDTTPYHGEILGYDPKTLQLVKSFITTPNSGDSEGGLWQGGASPAFDSAGNLFVAVGNGAWDQTNSAYGTNWGESLLKIPTSGALAVSFSNTLNWFTPNNWQNLNNGDLDVGSGGLTLLPDQAGPHTHIMVGAGKGGVLYVVDRDNLGGIHTPDNAIQEIPESGLPYNFSTPAYYNGNIYYSTNGGPMEQRAVGYNAADGTYIAANPIISNTSNFGAKGASCFISSNGNTKGIVWFLDGGGVQAYDAANISGNPIYRASAVIPTGNISCQNTKFSLPIVANSKLYYTAYSGTNTGHLLVYGMLPTAVGTPAAPSDAVAIPNSASAVTVTWTDNSTNESGFKVRRSTSPTSGFAQVGTTGAGISAYTDSGLTAATTYYYQIVATNANGDSNATNVAPATTFPTYAENGLTAYWNLDEVNASSGAAVADSTGHGHPGTLRGEAASAPAFINNGIGLHGNGQLSNVTVADAADLRFTAGQSFTLSAWVFPSALAGKEEAVVAKSRDTGNYYGVWINAAGRWAARGPGGDVVGPAAAVSTWAHVALVQNGAANTRTLYVNGVPAATGAAQAGDGTGAFVIGQWVSGTSNNESFPGTVDEVRLYSRALASSEVSNLMGPPVLAAFSVQTQGGAGTFGLPVWPVPAAKNEPRKGSTPGQYSLVLNFSAPVSGLKASLTRQDGAAPVGAAGTVSYDATGKVATVPLTGVGNAQALNVHFAGILPGNATADIPFSVLWGDVNLDNVVNTLDASLVKNNHTALISGANIVYDLNCDGVVNATDDTLATAAAGTSLRSETQTNLALYRVPTVSSTNGGNTAVMALDGNLGTRWESVQGVDPQYISVDLGTPCTIQQVILNWETAAGKTYTIDVSTDGLNPGVQAGSNWTNLATETNNTYSAGGSGTNPHPPYVSSLTGTYQFIRVFGTSRIGNYGYSLWDFQVLGVAGNGGIPAPTVNSAPSVTATANAPFSYQVTATNSPTSYGAASLPAGLSINPATGLISGTPTGTGTFNPTISATNATGTGSAPLALAVQTPLAAWQNAYFTSSDLANPAISGPKAAPAGDGITNLLKYALNLNPKANGTGGLPVESMQAVNAQTYLALTYTRVIAATDITYAVEVSGDLGVWSSGASSTAAVSAVNNPDGKTQTVTVRDSTAMGSSTKRFIHLKVTSP